MPPLKLSHYLAAGALVYLDALSYTAWLVHLVATIFSCNIPTVHLLELGLVRQ